MEKAGHSEEYFGDYRDHWWNSDYIELIANRLNLASKRTVLDVGCGMGHWTRIIAPHLPHGATIYGVDTDPKWLHTASDWTSAISSRGINLHVKHGDAMSLPFADASFDFVTCQTVLIHVNDPVHAIREMLRVLKPGGSLLCVEPDNLCATAMRSSFADELPAKECVEGFEFALTVERGRRALKQGDYSLGGLVPGYFNQVGIERIRTWISDKAIPLYPPYKEVEQRTILRDLTTWRRRNVARKSETLECFIAGGGDPARFDVIWQRSIESQVQYERAVNAGTVMLGGAAVMFLVSGRKSLS